MLDDPGLPWLECAVAMQPYPGESESGDLYVVQPFKGGALLGVVDGLGHGPDAAVAARAAIGALAAHAHEPPITLVRNCHQALRSTRGVVMGVASFDLGAGTLTWMSVGNIEGLLLRADPLSQPTYEMVLQRGGVVGYQLPLLRAEIVPLQPDDLLLFATDGITEGFSDGVIRNRTSQEIADRIMATHRKVTDDALVLVARFRGGSE